jgi:hypothetical protein
VQIYRSLLLGAALLAGGGACHSTIKQTSTDISPTAPGLRPNARVYVAMPEDALDKKNPVPDSGRRTALALDTAFKRQTRNVVMSRVPETRDDAIAHARDLQYEYVAFPTILKWEDRPTEWTGVRDKLQIQIDVISVATGQTVHSTLIDAKGKWMTDGSDQPQDLLPEPMDKFVRSIFRVTYTPTALER